MKTVLITGATGYVGQNLVGAYLDEGYHVIACARTQENLDAIAREHAGQNLIVKSLDVTDAEATRAVVAEYKPDIIVQASSFPRHKAAENIDPSLPFEQTALYKLNVEGANNVAQAAAQAGHPVHLCYISSGAVFEQHQTAVDLNAPREMKEPFARSRNLGEKLVAQTLAHADNVTTSFLYSPVILDENQLKGIIPSATDKALRGETITNNAPPDAGMNFVITKDFADMVLGVTTKQTEHFARYPVNGYRIGTAELLKKVASAVRVNNGGKTVPVEQGDITSAGMPKADETALRQVLGADFEWHPIDAILNVIVKNRVELTQHNATKGMQV